MTASSSSDTGNPPGTPKAACKGRLADYEIPKNFLEWEGPWPVNQIGKLETKVLEEKAK